MLETNISGILVRGNSRDTYTSLMVKEGFTGDMCWAKVEWDCLRQEP